MNLEDRDEEKPRDQLVAVISTSDVLEWEDIVSSSFVPLRCRAVAESFTGSVDVRRLSASITLSEIITGSVNVRRTSALASRSETDDVLLSIQLASSGRISQHGRDALMTPGSAVLYETNRPYEIDHRRPGQQQIIARVKRSALRLPDRFISEVCGRLIGGSESSLRIFSSFATTLFEESVNLNPESRHQMSEIAVDLITSLLQDIEKRPKGAFGNESLLAVLYAFVHDNLKSPKLSVEALAQHHHVSIRAVYDAFAPTGEPPAAYIRKVRLKRAASLMSDPDSESRTVASIAGECGYSDPSTFTRAFRREYGNPPSSWTPA